MFTLWKWMNVIEKQISPLNIQVDMCCRYRSSVSTCSCCMDNCPMNSITVTEKGIDISTCLECGICAAVCPTGALTWKRPSPKDMLAQAERTVAEQGHLYIYCSHSSFPEKKASGLKVPCLAAIPWEIWAALLISMPSFSVYLPAALCEHCPVTGGESLWQEQIRKAEKYCGKKVERFSDKAKMIQDAQKLPFDPGRRQFFSTLMREMKQTEREVVREFLGGISQIPVLPHSRNDEKQGILLQLLYHYQELQQKITVKLPVVQDQCDVCGACAILCPTQALARVEHDSHASLSLHPAQCVGCGLCEDVCWEKLIKLKEFPAESLFQKELSS